MSNINYTAINENFPRAGEDNDTQVFRDNFDTIKTNFREAKTELEDLWDKVVLKDALTGTSLDNDLNYNVIRQATFQNCRDKKFVGEPDTSEYEISYVNGSYQVITFDSPTTTVTLAEFPGDLNITGESDRLNAGKVTLELYSSDGDDKIVTFDVGGSVIPKKNTNDAWDYDPEVQNLLRVTVGSSSDPTIIEIWRHSNDLIFFNYVGQFS